MAPSPMVSPLSLLSTRRLGPLCLSQACGALNDNLVKNALIVLALFRAGEGGAGLVALAGALFIAPYALLSATAGQIADRFEKSRVIRWVKALEVALMAVSAAGFLLGSTPVLLAVLFGLGVQAALFGPVKYGILPDHLGPTEIVAGNGVIEAATFIAILLGTVGGGALVLLDGGPAIVAWPPRLPSRRRRLPIRRCASVGICWPRRYPSSARRGRSARSGCRSSACRGSGRSAPFCSRSSRRLPATHSVRTDTS